MPIATRPGRFTVGAVAIAAIVASGACRRVQAPEAPSPTPESTSTVLPSPLPLTSAQMESEQVNYVIGVDGLVGSDGMNAGTDRFFVTNNDARPHMLQVVRLKGDHGVDDVQAALRTGEWPASWATVLKETGEIVRRQTVMVRVKPMKVGSYALVDVQRRGGGPLALDVSFIKPITVAELPG